MMTMGCRIPAAILGAVAALLLAGCQATNGPLWGPASPRNGADEVVNPTTGTVIPGYPQNGRM